MSSYQMHGDAAAKKPVLPDLNFRQMCRDCKNPVPNIIEDFAAGDRICGDCGLVFENRIINERSEWRTFSNSEDNGDDPSRVGAVGDPLLGGDNHLESTTIGMRDGGSGQAKELNRVHGKATNQKAEKHLLNAFKSMATLCERISLGEHVTKQAKLLFKRVDDEKICRGKNESYVQAACIYLACRQEGATRTFKEICGLTNVPKKEIGKIVKIIGAKLGLVKENNDTLDSYVTRFASHLELDQEAEKAALTIALKSQRDGLLAGKSPISLVAASLFFASSLSNHPQSAKDIADIVGCTEATLKHAYKLLYEARQIIAPEINMPLGVDKLPPP